MRRGRTTVGLFGRFPALWQERPKGWKGLRTDRGRGSGGRCAEGIQAGHDGARLHILRGTGVNLLTPTVSTRPYTKAKLKAAVRICTAAFCNGIFKVELHGCLHRWGRTRGTRHSDPHGRSRCRDLDRQRNHSRDCRKAAKPHDSNRWFAH